MYLEEQTSDAPRIHRAEIQAYIQFKGKNGYFEIYDAVTKEKKQVPSIEILPINDSRFTVKPAMNEPGIFMFSGLYKSSKQTITVLEMKDGKTTVYIEGDWEMLKQDPNLKFTKVFYCMLKEGNRFLTAEFQLQGIAMIQWGEIATQGTSGMMTLTVSKEKTFKTKLGMFHTMEGGITGEPTAEEDMVAKYFSEDIKKAFASHDANYEYRHGDAPKAERIKPESVTEAKEAVPTIQLDDTAEEIHIEDVPF